MRIGIDITSIPLQPAGIGVYITYLTKSLIALAPKSGFEMLVFGRNDQQGLPEFSNAEFVACGAMTRAKRLMWEQVFLPKLLSRKGISLLHSPNYSIPVLAACRKVCTIHDLTSLNFPGRRKFWHGAYFRKMISVSAHFADFIIADSNSTRDDMIRHFPDVRSKIRTVYPSCRPIFGLEKETQSEQTSALPGLESDYFLFVSTIEPSKNLERLIDAFEIFKTRTGARTRLAIVGKMGWNYRETIAKIEKSPVTQDIKLLGYQDNQTLIALYRNALALIYPSLYEGFGIPPLEAMSVNTPVLASSASSIPEVVGDAALLFDPKDTNEIAHRMLQVYEDKELRKRLSDLGAQRARLFSWDRTARETIAIDELILR
jgi:glycosyltransferase involved in cell wall biosynthesis